MLYRSQSISFPSAGEAYAGLASLRSPTARMSTLREPCAWGAMDKSLLSTPPVQRRTLRRTFSVTNSSFSGLPSAPLSPPDKTRSPSHWRIRSSLCQDLRVTSGRTGLIDGFSGLLARTIDRPHNHQRENDDKRDSEHWSILGSRPVWASCPLVRRCRGARGRRSGRPGGSQRLLVSFRGPYLCWCRAMKSRMPRIIASINARPFLNVAGLCAASFRMPPHAVICLPSVTETIS